MDDMSQDARKRCMRRIQSCDTRAEIALRTALWHRGIRYHKNDKRLPGKPDIAISKYKIAIFVDGEYFHGKDWSIGQRDKVASGTNSQYWLSKIERNIQHDREIDAALNGLGWNILRFWSRDVLKNTDDCVVAVEAAIFDRKLEMY